MNNTIKGLIFFTCTLLYQNNTICQHLVTGIVKSKEDKSLLPGINVVEKGTTNGTITNSDGQFNLVVSSDSSSIVLSFIGYQTQEIEVRQQQKIIVSLKTDCIVCFFDQQQIEANLTSGLINMPLGGQISISFPTFIKQIALTSKINIQTDFENNENSQLGFGLKHLIAHCNFDLDLNWSHRKLILDPNFSLKSNSLESKLNLSGLRFIRGNHTLYLGYSQLRLQKVDDSIMRFQEGYIVGIGTYIGRPLKVGLISKMTYFNDVQQITAIIEKRIKRLNTFAQYERFDSFSELTLGIGFNFNYRLRKN